ncbi:MAG: hypothetical protein AB1758_29030 [Candidatus Eremiobacterota bacterium]
MVAVRFVALLSLALLAGCAIPVEEVDSLQLHLSPTADFRESFRLSVVPTASGASCRGVIALQGDSRELRQTLTRQEVDAVMRALESEGVWALRDGDSGQPEESVLYTLLEVEWGTGRSVSRWRGLPPPQARIARALLDSPLAPTLRPGLEAVQRRKAELKNSEAGATDRGPHASHDQPVAHPLDAAGGLGLFG